MQFVGQDHHYDSANSDDCNCERIDRSGDGFNGGRYHRCRCHNGARHRFGRNDCRDSRGRNIGDSRNVVSRQRQR